MQPRFVLVPAVPVDNHSFRVGTRFYAETASVGFYIYDNQNKVRLKHQFPTRQEGVAACAKMNAEARNPDELFPILRAE
ncbi:hypothetical protein QUC26_04695 [Pseudomonas asiatica]|nr:hypothetical protein [Pseudomonas asiatica]WJM54473.1 hypothetical protein QUC26_04695 [Pseudomonas asiatica]